MKTVDYIIVGQGIAGTLLGHFLTKENKTFLFIDDGYKSSATLVAAGILNPITGRRYVKSWKVDELFPFAKSTYTEMESLLGEQFFYTQNIIRSLFNGKEENEWLLRSDLPENKPYVASSLDFANYQGKIQMPYSAFELTQSGRVDIASVVQAYRKRWEIIEESFDYEHIEFKTDKVCYKGIQAQKIIFCEGYKAMYNPYFAHLNHLPTKGEILRVRIPNGNFQKLLKHKLFIVPFNNDEYWIGATNERHYTTVDTTEKNFKYLSDRLASFLETPYEILKHEAAVRPTVRDRRPLLGLHPEHTQLAIFNGLGTKGASLGPLWAKALCDHLVHQKPLTTEVDIKRLEK